MNFWVIKPRAVYPAQKNENYTLVKPSRSKSFQRVNHRFLHNVNRFLNPNTFKVFRTPKNFFSFLLAFEESDTATG